MISLSSEMTDSKGRRARGWLFFDADCEFCTRLAGWLCTWMRRRRLDIAPLQDPRVPVLLGVSGDELFRAIRFVDPDGRQYSGADALLALAAEFWWARPLVWAAKLPGVLAGAKSAYQWGAQRARCKALRPGSSGKCLRSAP